MNTNINNAQSIHDLSEQEIENILDAGAEFAIARDKFIAGEISEAELGKYINLDAWKKGYADSAEKLLKEALAKLGFQDIRYTRDGFITTEDRFDSVTPHQLTMLIYTHLDYSTIKQVRVQRNHGRVRYDIQLHDTKTILARVKVENEKDDLPLTEDVELKLVERDWLGADFEMGRTYMYVFDAFHEVYGVYPDKLSHPEDYAHLGQMMNLALAGERFDI